MFFEVLLVQQPVADCLTFAIVEMLVQFPASGQRVQTTTTAQSLFFMNSHFVRQVALRVEQRDDLRNLDPTEKIRRLFQVLFGREPSAAELQIAVGFQEPLDQDGGGKSEGSKLVWIRFIQGLLMSNEFVFID